MCKLDYSEESIDKLGHWFARMANKVDKTPGELLAEKQEIPEKYWSYIKPWEIDNQTISLCYDIGFYIGEVLIKTIPGTKWILRKKPKDDVDLYQPVLESPDHQTLFNPLAVLANVATGLISGKNGPDTLKKVFEFHAKYFREGIDLQKFKK